MKTLNFKISNTGRKDYPINVQVLRSINDKTYYCGEGRFCRNNKEAERYVNGFRTTERVEIG